jgi:hypothetical protein
MGTSEPFTDILHLTHIRRIWGYPLPVNPLSPSPQGGGSKWGAQLLAKNFTQKIGFVLGVPFQKNFTLNFSKFF